MKKTALKNAVKSHLEPFSYVARLAKATNIFFFALDCFQIWLCSADFIRLKQTCFLMSRQKLLDRPPAFGQHCSFWSWNISARLMLFAFWRQILLFRVSRSFLPHTCGARMSTNCVLWKKFETKFTASPRHLTSDNVSCRSVVKNENSASFCFVSSSKKRHQSAAKQH